MQTKELAVRQDATLSSALLELRMAIPLSGVCPVIDDYDFMHKHRGERRDEVNRSCVQSEKPKEIRRLVTEFWIPEHPKVHSYQGTDQVREDLRSIHLGEERKKRNICNHAMPQRSACRHRLWPVRSSVLSGLVRRPRPRVGVHESPTDGDITSRYPR